MKELQLKIKDWWMHLALREKRIVAIGGVLLAIFILYAGVITPYFSHVNEMRERISTAQKTLRWMQAADKEMAKQTNQTKREEKANSPVALLSIMQKEIRQAHLDQFLTQLKQASHDSIEVHFEKVEFDKFMQLLLNVVAKQHVIVSQFSAMADGAPGIVNVELVLAVN